MTKSRDLGNLAQTVAVNLPTALGTAGQTLVVNSGADGLEFGAASGGSGVTVYTGLSGTDGTPAGATYLLNASSPSAGDLAYVSSNTSLYQNNGNGWYRIAVINTTPTISSVADASSNTTPFTLEGGTNTVITVTASDADEGTDLTYSHSVTSGSLNGTTVTQGTGASENVFTITPHASNATTFSLTFTVSDNINAATSVAAFTLEFQITDSHFTSLLMATDGLAGDNNDISDSSSNNHPITPYNDAHAGTFSPYRHGGYSTYFDGSGDYLSLASSTDFTLDGNFTIDFWVNILDSNIGAIVSSGQSSFVSGASALIWDHGTQVNKLSFWAQNISSTSLVATNTLDLNRWYFISVVRDNGVITIYQDGASVSTYNSSSTISLSASGMRIGAYWNGQVNAYITDFRIVKGTPITPASGGPTERLTAVTNTSLLTCHLPYFADGSSSAHSITVNGDPETKPFGPYDYNEYSESINGGSVYFDGSGDYLTYSAGNEIGFSTGDFTVEFWAYNKFSTGSLQKIIETRTASNWIIQIASTNHFQWYNGSTTVFNYDISYTKNTWAHFVVTRDGTTLRLFVNGRLVSTTTDSVSYSVSSGTVYISRRYNDNLDYFSGYLTDLRIVKGSVVTEYQTSSTTTDTQIFTPPTAPLTAITDTSLLISGTDASIIDKSQTSNLKLVGNTTGSTAQAKFANTKSMYFDGNGDSVFVPYESIPSFGIIEFTIEGWIYMNNLTGNQLIVDKWVSGNSQGFQFYHRSTGSSLTFYVGNVIVVQDPSSSSISAQTWHHVAVTRDSGANVRLYVDGLKKAQSFSPVSLDNTLPLRLGASATSTNYFNGYMQDVRLSNKALYTADDESSNIPSEPLKG